MFLDEVRVQHTLLPRTTQKPDRLSDDIISKNDPVTRAVMSMTACDRLPVTQLPKDSTAIEDSRA